jgi:hypothetical protein
MDVGHALGSELTFTDADYHTLQPQASVAFLSEVRKPQSSP